MSIQGQYLAWISHFVKQVVKMKHALNKRVRVPKSEDEMKEFVHERMLRLEETQAKIVYMRHIENKTIREIGEDLGIPRSTVHRTLRTAISIMKQ